MHAHQSCTQAGRPSPALHDVGNTTQAIHAPQGKTARNEMLFIGATLVQLPSVLREHSRAAAKRKNSGVMAPQLPQKIRDDQVELMMAGGISPLKTARCRAKNTGAQVLPEEDFHFSGVNLQHKD